MPELPAWSNKVERGRILREIRSVLLEVWDPIGVRKYPQAQDEYDGYIGRIFALLLEQSSDDAILDYLFWAVKEHMGFEQAKREDMLPTVQALRNIRLPQPK
ncbi:MAG TPA: hypothetical protein VEJ46_05085 [Candidatus Acidoferrum sp.]|nr:hypothetical protein [Candidatus Acidoferrum sp.]